MIATVAEFVRYFDAVNRRAMRDIGALPAEADGWRPPSGAGENAWTINQLVGHMCGSRLYFASAYRGEGWISPEPPDVGTRASWVPALQQSFAELSARLTGTPEDWLGRKVAMIDTAGSLSGWRVLMMMMEHDIHHRSQVETYAGLNGWPVMDIYGRSAETIGALQESERARHSANHP